MPKTKTQITVGFIMGICITPALMLGLLLGLLKLGFDAGNELAERFIEWVSGERND